jgi:hypothetical protein
VQNRLQSLQQTVNPNSTVVTQMKKAIISCLALFASLALVQAQTIAGWTFETSVPATAGPHAAEVGSGSALGFHNSGSTVYSNPVGNGSGESFSSNFWGVGDYYQFQVSTVGFSNIGLSWDQTRSSTGPADWELQFSTDGSTFSTGMAYSIGALSWSSTTPNPDSTFTLDMTAVTDLNNQPEVFFRIVAASAAAGTGGTARVDNFTVVQVPEPSTFALMALAGGLFLAVRRRK